MNLVQSAGEVLEAIQQIKGTAGPGFCTNFYPVRAKLDAWISRQELLEVRGEKAACFYRKDRDFLHLYFVAESPAALAEEVAKSDTIRYNPVSLDLVGLEVAIAPQEKLLNDSGFRTYSKLVRLARAASSLPDSNANDQPNGPIEFAVKNDAPEIMAQLEDFFNAYADQLPQLEEIEAAIDARQIVTLKNEGKVAAFVHFETQGVASTVRYWMVARPFRGQGLGETVLRHYLSSHPAVRRFTLWVNANNENALKKYARFDYAPDGLTDHVLVNDKIKA